MKYILLSFSVLMFACNDNKTNTSGSQSGQEQKQEVKQLPEPLVDNGPEAYFTANGGDWSADLKSSMNGTFPLVLTQNNGKDTLRSTLNRTMEGNGKPASGKSSVTFTGVIKSGDKEETVELGISPGACTAKSGEKTNFTCKISVGKKSLSGCGNYTEN